jgi:ribonuclease HI/pterin-4a-carbinolamine dehydratase
MWKKTKHGLYKQFNFINFREAFEFMKRAADIAENYNHHFRWENNWNVVQIWLSTHEEQNKITDLDYRVADALDKIDIFNKAQSSDTLSEPGQQPGTYRKVKIYADGGSRGNPGPSASGYVVLDMNDNILVDEGYYLGITTNNQAEYTALKIALEKCLEMGVREVDVYMDSLLVINQMKGIFKVKNRDLWPLHDNISSLVKKFNKVNFQHVPRELNKLADAAVNRELDKKLSNS